MNAFVQKGLLAPCRREAAADPKYKQKMNLRPGLENAAARRQTEIKNASVRATQEIGEISATSAECFRLDTSGAFD
ncbi:MAG TPA: hypothetical protein VFG04_26680 [Planctomycetaceae bacterium]|jgi:hypothetical protein|nr:hypothetical protein [Planctomycetaceae bacterium]